MDSWITVRFYAVVPKEAGQASFEACLNQTMRLGPNPARDIDADTIIQASNLSEKGDRILGDLIRIQSENLPSLIPTKGLPPEKLGLARDAGLGHHTAFVYDRKVGVLAYQLAKNAVSLGRFSL
jgi:hypothetical protein